MDAMAEAPILLAFDFSAAARRALVVTRDLAQAFGTTVAVVSVNDEPVATAMLRASHGEALRKLANEEAHEALTDIEHEVLCPHGDPVVALLDAIHLLKPKMVVTGTAGKGRVKQALLGSVSHALVTRAGVPVLTVP